MTHIRTNRGRRFVKLAVTVLTLVGVTACNEFLVAENPGAIEAIDVNDPAYVNLLANMPIFGMQDAYDDHLYWNGQMTDELTNRNAINPFIEEGQIDRRELYSDMTYLTAFLYNLLARSRFLADDATTRMKEILADSASSDLRVARALAFAGFSRVALAESYCVTPIDLSAPKSSDVMFSDAIANANEAVTIAKAYKAKIEGRTPVNTAGVLGADSVMNFALVVGARAALNRNDKAAAIAFASQVPATFTYSLYYSSNNTAQHHRTYNRLTLGSNASIDNTPFAAMTTDPRIPRITTGTATRLGIPLSPPSYSTFNNSVAGAPFAADMSMRIASGLEAAYIVAEAQGPTAETLAFVNTRRAAGLQAPVTLAGDALMAELRDQRSRDFFLDGHRLGDLRRYKQFYNVDLFPKGPYPGTTTGQVYNDAVTCWPLPTAEINANPNIEK